MLFCSCWSMTGFPSIFVASPPTKEAWGRKKSIGTALAMSISVLLGSVEVLLLKDLLGAFSSRVTITWSKSAWRQATGSVGPKSEVLLPSGSFADVLLSSSLHLWPLSHGVACLWPQEDQAKECVWFQEMLTTYQIQLDLTSPAWACAYVYQRHLLCEFGRQKCAGLQGLLSQALFAVTVH